MVLCDQVLLQNPFATPDLYRHILKQFRQTALLPDYLTLDSFDVQLLLEHFSSPRSPVRQLNIRLETHAQIPCASFTKRLPTKQAFPQLQYLSLGGRRFTLTRQ